MQSKKYEIYSQSNAIVEEAYSYIKANFNFCNIDNKIKTLAIISSNPGEGKTSTAINLALNIAKGGMKVLFVDVDLRKPISVKRLGGNDCLGLSNVLIEGIEIDDVTMPTNIENLFYIPCGFKPKNPAELLSSINFDNFLEAAENEYDITILDTPSLSSVTDAIIIAAKSNAAILVIKSGFGDIAKLKRTKEQLSKINANVIGVILNRVDKGEYKKYFEGYDYFVDETKLIKKFQHKKIFSKGKVKSTHTNNSSS